MHQKLIDTIGNTPLVELSRLNTQAKVTVLAKLEGNNPGGSVKDRAASYLIRHALDQGLLKGGRRIIEATSGNTGIALAMIAAYHKVPIELVMPETATRERVLTMQAYGAKVTLVSEAKGMEGARDHALEQAEKGDAVILNQFDNPENARAHFETTGPEIWRDTAGKVTHFVSAMGTTGTITGTSRFLKAKNKHIRIIGAQPAEDSKIPGIRRWPLEYRPKIFDPAAVDETVDVDQEQATKMAHRLAAEEGVFAGMSSGGAAHIALDLAEKLDEGVVVFVVCDRGDRYLSSPLFEGQG